MDEYIEREETLHRMKVDIRPPFAVVADMPAADVAPVVHGRWVEWYPPKHMILTGEEMLYRCSSCDAKYSDVESFRFCPYCGARMDSEASDGQT